MKQHLIKIAIILALLLSPILSLPVNAQTENKILSITDSINPGKATLYSGTYVYQGTRSSTDCSSGGGTKTRPYYKRADANYYLYADYQNGRCDFPNGFTWYIADSITSPATNWVYWGWDASDMNYPESTGPGYSWWWADLSNNEVTVIVTDEASGVAPTVSTMEASLVTTTSGTLEGNIVADGGATTDRGFVYSSTDATPTISEPGVTQIAKGTGTGTYTEVVSSLTAGATYYYQAYGHNTYGTTYGGVKSFTTPTTSAPNKYVTNASPANGVYVWIGSYYGKPAWKHQTSNYWLYYSMYGMVTPTNHYWYIDNELKNEHGGEDFYYDHEDAAACPASGWRFPDNSAASVTIIDYPQVDFTNGSSFSPGSPTGGTNNNPIGRFLLDADISGASLTAVTVNAAGTRSGVTNLKLWSSTDATFNSGSDTQLNSQSDGATVTFSGFSSAISASGTYYFITTDLGVSATGTFTLTIGSIANLTISGGASSTVFSNAALTSSQITITPAIDINITGNGTTIATGDTTPSPADHTDFGNADTVTGSVVRTFTIQNLNPGTISLTGSSPYVVITGHTADFSLTQTPANSITESTPTTFQITFDPTTTGTRSASISIANNDPDENPYTFSVQGTGVSTPTITTLEASSVSANSATLGGNITSDGGVAVTERGVVYSTSDATPTSGETGVTQDANGSGTGSFSESIGSLALATHYYFQAYATNPQGTSYGGVLEFTTRNTVSSITATDSTPTNAASVNWNVSFAAAVTGLSASNFSLVNSGLTAPGITDVSGSGTNWTVTANTGTGSGTLGLNLTSDTGLNALLSNIPFTGDVYAIDRYAPDTTITGSPSNPSGNSVSFTFSGDDGTGSGIASYQCDLDGSYTSCSSPQPYSSLSDGSHTFQVYAVDNAGNTDPTPASFTWTVDAVSPDTTITGNPTKPSNNASATFTFTGDDGSGIASFECELDGTGTSFAPCSSPWDYTGMTDETHTFLVRAIDIAGNTDPTPASFTWRVDTAAPNLTLPADITREATSVTGTIVTFTATADDLMDDSLPVTCTPPSGSSFPLGETTVNCSATDSASNTASGSFKVTITPSTNAELSALTASSGSFKPIFDPATTGYGLPVDPAVSTLTLTPTAAYPAATIQVRINAGGWSAVPSGTPSPDLPLNVGSNTVQILVTAEDGSTTKTYSISVSRLPASPTTLLPSGQITDTTPDYTWKHISGATHYDLQVYSYTSASFVVNVTSLPAGSICDAVTCSYNPGTALTGIDFFFQVRARSVRIVGPISARRYFSVSDPLAAPVTLAPNGTISDTTPTYTWNAITSATRYDVYVYSYTSASNVISQPSMSAAGLCPGGTCSYTPSTILAPGNFRFTVRARNLGGTSALSPWKYFTVSP
jgi:hypothetical protein